MQQFEVGRSGARRLQGEHVDLRIGETVEPGLRLAAVEPALDDAEAEGVAEDCERPVEIGHGERRVVDAEEEPGRVPPARGRRAAGEVDQLDRVAVRIADLEGGDAAGGCGQRLRAVRADRCRMVGDETRGGRLHGAHRDRDVLEDRVVRACPGRIGRSGRVEGQEGEPLAPEAHPQPPRGGAGEPQSREDRLRGRLGRCDRREAERVAVEGLCPPEIRHRAAHRDDAADERWVLPVLRHRPPSSARGRYRALTRAGRPGPGPAGAVGRAVAEARRRRGRRGSGNPAARRRSRSPRGVPGCGPCLRAR